jgi:hypothetical protein
MRITEFVSATGDELAHVKDLLFRGVMPWPAENCLPQGRRWREFTPNQVERWRAMKALMSLGVRSDVAARAVRLGLHEPVQDALKAVHADD